MPKLTIDGIAVEVEPGTSILQACERLGIEVPRFCYHERLSVPANCRMCLVEMEKAPKPVASCAMPCGEGMVVRTDTEMVAKARRGVMEFLLINHPLDCPICDQGGECDLQDQAVAYGADRSRYAEAKRSVTEKEMGPLVKTAMTRCIQCTRCIRFVNEIAGVPALGAVGRGEHMEIVNALESGVCSELSGNLVDVCPVGALTNKPYAFAARPWELRKTETIDVMDAVGSNIRVDSRGPEVLRILPRTNDDINEDWIGDKTRHVCDGLTKRRLDRPYVRKDGKLAPVSWDEAFAAIAARLKGVPGERIAALAGDLADVESMLALKDLMAALGSPHLDCRQDGARFDTSAPVGWRFNTTIAGIEKADLALLIGTNPRWEAPIVNARLRKRWRKGGFTAASVGVPYDLTYPVANLGGGVETLKALIDGSHAFAATLRAAQRPMLIIGAGALARPDGAAVQALARTLAETYGLVREDWNGFNVLHTAAARVGGLEIGFLPGANGLDRDGILDAASSGAVEVVYLLGADEIPMERLGTAFVIYQGHHGDAGAARADVVLPGAAYTEKSAIYVNTEGRPQQATRAVFPPGEAREDWTIVRALSDRLGRRLPYDSLTQVRARLAAVAPHLAELGIVTPAPWTAFGTAGPVAAAPFMSTIVNYYVTDAISRASPTMAACTERFVRPGEERTGTHG
jgi:NADH-quinone oxidoreductase subunit G